MGRGTYRASSQGEIIGQLSHTCTDYAVRWKQLGAWGPCAKSMGSCVTASSCARSTQSGVVLTSKCCAMCWLPHCGVCQRGLMSTLTGLPSFLVRQYRSSASIPLWADKLFLYCPQLVKLSTQHPVPSWHPDCQDKVPTGTSSASVPNNCTGDPQKHFHIATPTPRATEPLKPAEPGRRMPRPLSPGRGERSFPKLSQAGT